MILHIPPDARDISAIRRAADEIAKGGLAVFPTRGLYGIGADIGQTDAVARVFRAKKRAADRPIAILIPSRSGLSDYASSVPEAAGPLIEAFWPGRLTLVFSAREMVPAMLTGGTGKIGIREPQHPVAAALLKILGRAITATSANLSGQPGCAAVADIAPEVKAEMAIILDAGPLAGGVGSTVVDVTTSPVTILREGAVPESEIRKCLSPLQP